MRIERIVCGIEPGGHGVGAALRAARIAPEGAPLVLIGAADIGAAAMGQPLGGDIDMGPMPAGPFMSLDDLEDAVRADLDRAVQALGGRPGVATRIEVGALAPALGEAAHEGTLIAIDAAREGRVLGIIDGDPGTWLLHEAPGPVFLSRGSEEDAGGFPALVVAGVDGSDPSALAAQAAGEIAERTGAELRLVMARGGRGADRDAVEAQRARLPAHQLVEDRRNAVHALTRSDADLIVVGSRGLHGLRALGSVSERVAHGAEASVLVAR